MDNKPILYGGQIHKPLDYHHDLSKGERSYLKEHKISEQDFSRMDSVSQNEWKDECKNPAYESMRKYKGR